MSQITRGFHTQTRILERVAHVFGLPIERVLVHHVTLSNELRDVVEEMLSLSHFRWDDQTRSVADGFFLLAPEQRAIVEGMIAQLRDMRGTRANASSSQHTAIPGRHARGAVEIETDTVVAPRVRKRATV